MLICQQIGKLKKEQIFDSVTLLNFEIKQAISNTLKSQNFPISREQWVILDCIFKNTRLSQRDLAEETRKDPAALTRSLDLLVKKGLVKRVNNPNDRRAYHLELSVDGSRLYNRIQPHIDKLYKKILTGLSDSQLKEFKSTINRISKNINS